MSPTREGAAIIGNIRKAMSQGRLERSGAR